MEQSWTSGGPPRRPRSGGRSGWAARKQRFLADLRARTGVDIRSRGGRWGTCASGSVAILGSAENRPGQWWFGLNEVDFRDPARNALGVILLAERDGTLVAFGLDRRTVEELLPTLSRSGDEVKLNLLEFGGHYVLQAHEHDHDLTAAQGSFDWLVDACGADPDAERADASVATEAVAAEAATAYALAAPAAAGAVRASPDRPADTHRFFARVHDGKLEPLDDTGLRDGEIVLVNAVSRPDAPANTFLRGLVASVTASDLPRDLAERHGDYARGRRRP